MKKTAVTTMHELTSQEQYATIGGAVWLAPAAKALFKVAGGVLAAGAAYDGAQDFMDGYRACR